MEANVQGSQSGLNGNICAEHQGTVRAMHRNQGMGKRSGRRESVCKEARGRKEFAATGRQKVSMRGKAGEMVLEQSATATYLNTSTAWFSCGDNGPLQNCL